MAERGGNEGAIPPEVGATLPPPAPEVPGESAIPPEVDALLPPPAPEVPGGNEGAIPPEAGALLPPPAPEVPLPRDPPALDPEVGAVELPMPARREEEDRVVISKQLNQNSIEVGLKFKV